jgi:hypothetical protein
MRAVPYDGSVSGSVTIVDPASPPPAAGSGAFDADLVLLPDRLDGDRGVYSDQLITAVKALRADGVDARWFHDVDHRLWHGERSAIVDLVVIPFVVGIASSAGWAALVGLLSRRSGPVKLKVGYRKDPLRGEERWVELEGSSADVAAALEQLSPWRSPGPPLDQGKAVQSE